MATKTKTVRELVSLLTENFQDRDLVIASVVVKGYKEVLISFKYESYTLSLAISPDTFRQVYYDLPSLVVSRNLNIKEVREVVDYAGDRKNSSED